MSTQIRIARIDGQYGVLLVERGEISVDGRIQPSLVRTYGSYASRRDAERDAARRRYARRRAALAKAGGR